MSPDGAPLEQSRVREFAKYKHITFVAGRYEGSDQRWIDANVDAIVSVGDYVLSGGELAAAVVIDSCVCACCPVRWATPNRPPLNRLPTANWTGHNMHSRRPMPSKFRQNLPTVITLRSTAGASNKHSFAPGCIAPICWHEPISRWKNSPCSTSTPKSG